MKKKQFYKYFEFIAELSSLDKKQKVLESSMIYLKTSKFFHELLECTNEKEINDRINEIEHKVFFLANSFFMLIQKENKVDDSKSNQLLETTKRHLQKVVNQEDVLIEDSFFILDNFCFGLPKEYDNRYKNIREATRIYLSEKNLYTQLIEDKNESTVNSKISYKLSLTKMDAEYTASRKIIFLQLLGFLDNIKEWKNYEDYTQCTEVVKHIINEKGQTVERYLRALSKPNGGDNDPFNTKSNQELIRDITRLINSHKKGERRKSNKE